MTTNPIDDYYHLMDIEPDASQEEIEKQYKFLANAFHPDKHPTLEGKAKAEEKFKLINEAYSVLKDPDKRQAYDSTRKSAPKSRSATPPPPAPTPPPPPRKKPEIVLSTNNLDFGVITKGGNKVRSFTIDNRGGMPNEIHIGWEKEPAWAVFDDPVMDPLHTFPIKVTVKVKTGKLAADLYSGRIVVIVDGEEYGVSVSLKVVVPTPAPAPIPVSPTPKTTTTTPRSKRTPTPTRVYTPPPATPPKVSILWVIFITSIVTLGIILVASLVRAISAGNPNQSSQTTPNAPQNTQIPQSTLTLVQTYDPNLVCGGDVPTRLRIGMRAHGIGDIYNSILVYNDLPGQATDTFYLDNSVDFTIIDGPFCGAPDVNFFIAWKIKTDPDMVNGSGVGPQGLQIGWVYEWEGNKYRGPYEIEPSK